MQLTAIILTDILFLALMAFAVSLDRRVARIETQHRHEMNRLTERLWQVKRKAEALRGTVDDLTEVTGSADAISRHRAGEEERRFNEAVASILGYGAAPAADMDAEGEK